MEIGPRHCHYCAEHFGQSVLVGRQRPWGCAIEINISFPNHSQAEARDAALQLRGYLLNRAVVADAEVVKERDDTADLGSTLQLVLAAPVVVAFANQLSEVIGDWLRDRVAKDDAHASADTLTVEVKRTSGDNSESVSASGSPEEVRDVLERFMSDELTDGG